MTFFLLLLIINNTHNVEYVGISDHGPVTAYLLRDCQAMGRGSLKIISVDNGKGQLSGAAIHGWYPGDHGYHYRGEIFFYDQGKWMCSGSYISKESEIRSQILVNIRARLSPLGEAVPLVESLLLGIYHRDIQQLFRDSGLSFLLALSGLHLVILLEVMKKTIFKILPQRLVFPFSILFVLFFLWLVGIRHSLVRCFIYMVLADFIKERGVFVDRFFLLIIGLGIHISIYPQSCLSMGFQFSYAAMLGIVLYTPLYQWFLRRYLPDLLADCISLSLGAQALVTPLQIIYFKEIHPLSLFFVIPMAPLVTAILIGGIIYLCLFWVPYIKSLSIVFITAVNRLAICLGGFFSKLPKVECSTIIDKTLLWVLLSLLLPFLLGIIYCLRGFHEKRIQSELRFTKRDKNFIGYDGIGSPKTMGPEFPYQSGGSKTNCG